MANEQNLKPPTTNEARERGKKGGEASGEARREKRRLREAVEKVLMAEYEEADGSKLTGYEKAAISVFKKAVNGYDVAAFNAMRDLIGEKPTEKVDASVTTENQNLLKDYLEAMKHGGG